MIYPEKQLEKNHLAQQIAKETLVELSDIICAGMSEADIERLVCERMIQKGSGPFWYHGVGALYCLEKGQLCP